MNSGPLLLCGILEFPYDGNIESWMPQITIRKYSTRTVRYDRSYTELTKYEKP
jgi:hypothetical protein